MSHELFTPYVFAGLYAFAVVGVTAISCMVMNNMNLPKDDE